jgi:hypothetical protein
MKLWQTTKTMTQTGEKTSGGIMSADSCSIITSRDQQHSNKRHNESNSNQGETTAKT